MTKNQFKKALNAELWAADMAEYKVIKVDEIGANTVLYFDIKKMPVNMRLLRWLNDRFQNGISITKKNRSLVFINTPLQEKVDLS